LRGWVERFWGTLWRECLEQAIFRGLDDARQRIALFVDHYNFQRPHSGIEGLVPADRFFAAADQVKARLRERVAENALQMARQGVPRKSVYLTGRVGSESVSLHAEGDRVILLSGDGRREEVDLQAAGARDDEAEQVLPPSVSGSPVVRTEPRSDPFPAPPGSSPLDRALRDIRAALEESGESGASRVLDSDSEEEGLPS
jgi:hypothetical protein